MDYFQLHRNYFNWCFENPDKVKPIHTAIFCFAIEHCNRLGWKQKFGFPTTMAMEALGIKSYNTFINGLKELVEFGFIEMIEKSKNQYSANIIALSNFNKAHNKALDKAFTKHGTKQSESTVQSTDSIIKQDTINKEQSTTIQPNHIITNWIENAFETEKANNAWLDWIEHKVNKSGSFNRVEQRHSYNSLRELSTVAGVFSENNVAKLIATAIRKGWKDFYLTEEMEAKKRKAEMP